MNIETIPLIRSPRRKTIAIQVGRDGRVTVRAPERMSETAIRAFVAKQESWVQKRVKEMLKRRRPNRTFCDGECFLLRGAEVKLEIVERGARSLVLGETFQLVARDRFRARELFERRYKEAAREHLSLRVPQYARRMGVKHGAVRLSNARHTWGSCAPDNRLSFTWRLTMAPDEVIDYIIVQELAHVVQKNHGKRFWAKVARFCPDYKKRRAWLGVQGHLLEI